ncbi:MAG: flagellar hook-length control protein FliK [Candidatus Latescibacteria bacterium]|nr:flagellar hook-length control protein FliK [Candidatus Latescibacterota bacterium]
MRTLGLRLSLLTVGGDETAGLSDILRGGDAPGVRGLVLKSGMIFEWKLLAWYRSGGDQAVLRTLLAHDMKGILLEFFRKTRGRRTGGSAGRALGDLEDKARSLFGAVTKRQLSNVLNSRGDRQVLRFELPFGDVAARDHASLTVRGDKDQGGVGIKPGTGSIAFSIETDGLGRVDVLMRFRGRESVTLGFMFDGEEQRSLAEELSETMRRSFADRGYTVHSVSFGVRGDDNAAYDVGSTPHERGGVDLTG